MTIAVTGVAGYLGAGVARRLVAAGERPRLLARNPAAVPDDLADGDVAQASYADAPSMTAALAGVDTLYLVSGREDARRVDQHVTAVDSALAAGVSRIVYVSFIGAAPEATFTFARDHFATEVHIRSTGVRHTFLRSSMYVDFLPGLVGPDHTITGPAGPADANQISWVARDDIADVAAVVLREEPEQETFVLTGPAALSMAETVQALSEAAGREIRYVEEGLDQARESRRHFGAPAFEVEGWITSYAAMATGEMGAVTDAVQRFTDRPAIGVAEWLAAHPDAVAPLR